MTTFPGVAGEIEALIGVEATTAMLRKWGGCQIDLPKRAAKSTLAGVIGAEAVEMLAKHYGHGKITLPCASMRGIGGRRAEARKMLQAGASLQEVALACDIHTRTVSKYRAELEEEGQTRQIRMPFDRD